MSGYTHLEVRICQASMEEAVVAKSFATWSCTPVTQTALSSYCIQPVIPINLTLLEEAQSTHVEALNSVSNHMRQPALTCWKSVQYASKAGEVGSYVGDDKRHIGVQGSLWVPPFLR